MIIHSEDCCHSYAAAESDADHVDSRQRPEGRTGRDDQGPRGRKPVRSDSS